MNIYVPCGCIHTMSPVPDVASTSANGLAHHRNNLAGWWKHRQIILLLYLVMMSLLSHSWSLLIFSGCRNSMTLFQCCAWEWDCFIFVGQRKSSWYLPWCTWSTVAFLPNNGTAYGCTLSLSGDSFTYTVCMYAQNQKFRLSLMRYTSHRYKFTWLPTPMCSIWFDRTFHRTHDAQSVSQI